MVVRYLAVINNSFQLRCRGTVLAKRHILPQPQGQRANRCLHIRCDILAVCSRIGRQLFLIQALQIIKGLLGSEAIQAVALPLQGSQIVKAGRLDSLFLSFHFVDNSRLSVTICPYRFRSRFVLQLLPGSGKPSAGEFRHIEGLALKRTDCFIPLDDQRQRRRHYPAHIQGVAIQDREKAGGVNPHKPVRTGPAECRPVKQVIVRTRPQVFKSITDSRILHRADPEPENRLAASGLLIDQPENQFTFPASIGSAHHSVHTFILHQTTQDAKLLFLILCHIILPMGGKNRQIRIPPFGVLLPIGFRLGQLHQMAHAPGHQPAAALQIPIFFLLCSQHCGQRLGHTGLFGYHKLHSSEPPSLSKNFENCSSACLPACSRHIKVTPAIVPSVKDRKCDTALHMCRTSFGF